MIYNLSPITNLLTADLPNRDVWRERIQSFFNNQEYDADLQDWYYDKLINNISEVDQLLRGINFVDPYTGLFSMPSPYIEATHSLLSSSEIIISISMERNF